MAAAKYDAKGKEGKEGKPEKNEVKDDANPYEFKVILLGMSGVGKTSLFLRIRDGKFYSDTRNIRTTDQGIKKTIKVGQEQVEITLYDSATGMEYHERTLTKDYYRDSDIALLVYSADSIESVKRLVSYIAKVDENAPGVNKIIIRNKIDLEDQSVREHEVPAMITSKGYILSTIKHFCKTSALNLEDGGIDDLLLKIGKIILARRKALDSVHTPIIINRFDSFRAGANQQARQQTETRQSNCC